MKIRRVQYNIDYVHILTFREEYKQAVIPYFGLPNLRYGIDHENTHNESIRLIYKSEHLALSLRKEGFTFVFEGQSEELKNQNGVVKLFWDLFSRVKNFKGFSKTVRHSIILNSVDILDKSIVEKTLESPKYLNINPFGKLSDFGCVYEITKDKKFIKFEIGSYSEKDIERHDLMPFKIPENEDLIGDNVGLMCRAENREDSNNISFSKFKSLLLETEKLIDDFEKSE